MTRTIKFRAWNRITQSMDYNDVFIRGSGNVPIYEGKEQPQLIVMQYTGLLDKNGKEIYEGDVIRKNEGSLEPLMIGKGGCYEVIFFNGAFRASDLMTGFGHPKDFYLHEKLNETAHLRYYEVIGNIYESTTPTERVMGEKQ